jgi:hypothetical protein
VHDAIREHIDSLRERGETVPEPSSIAEKVQVA